jgi:predicted HAD superfamily Cof-like phosphohydrolase
MVDVVSIFSQQAEFMEASGQTVGTANADQAALYARLIEEEVTETFDAWKVAVMAIASDSFNSEKTVTDVTEVTDGLIDTIYVCIGMLHSLGINSQAAWDEVHGSNMTKIDPATGFVIRRDDGKILKPEGFRQPDLAKVVRMSWNIEESA